MAWWYKLVLDCYSTVQFTQKAKGRATLVAVMQDASTAITGQVEVNQQEEIPKSNPFAVIMNAPRHQAPRKKPKAGDPPMAQPAIAMMAAASRMANKNKQKSTSKTPNSRVMLTCFS